MSNKSAITVGLNAILKCGTVCKMSLQFMDCGFSIQGNQSQPFTTQIYKSFLLVL